MKSTMHLQGSETYLLGVSGGLDSMVMVSLFREAGLRFGMAHCHFGLRGEEADGDVAFIEALSHQLSIPLHVKHFDTPEVARREHLSIQEAARVLRYAWFESLRQDFTYSHIATAHHRDDELETMFINLIRGTGLQGLKGMDPQAGHIIHPLLFASREEIATYARQHGLLYREDSSNAGQKYLRNKIRHSLLPMLEAFRPGIRQRLYNNMLRFRAESDLLTHAIQQMDETARQQSSSPWTHYPKPAALSGPALAAYTHSYLQEYGFNFHQSSQIAASWGGEPGKQFYTSDYECLIDRNELIIRKKASSETEVFEISGEEETICQPFCATLSIIPAHETRNLDQGRFIAFLDYDKLQYPLIIRKWKSGDMFQPLGMQGKRKLSDFFIDQKLSRFEKEAVWLFESAGKIAWVAGYRIDHRFRVGRKTKWVLRIEIQHDATFLP